MAGYVAYTAALSPVAAAQIRLTNWRDVADAYAEQTLLRKARWEADPTPDSYGIYQDAVHQYRAAVTHVRVADAALSAALEGSADGRRTAA